jgi:uncharacterized repeat protein (TIGR03837 family)
MVRSWDIFCSVIDNYGDLGVCWRLARQLALERKQTVRLWVDDIDALHKFGFGFDPGTETLRLHDVEIRHWDSSGKTPFPAVEPAEIVIEGFGVRLPEGYLLAMAKRALPPAWINLEYLSAEPWVETHHGLPSPHPTLPLTKYFIFPGFTEKTGGLIMERGLATARDAVSTLRSKVPGGGALLVSLFSYKNAALPGLVEAWKSSPTPVVCVVPEGPAHDQLSTLLARPFTRGTQYQVGALALHPFPFVNQDGYDNLLWGLDVNFVRGEDSFVRAQLAARPLVWQAYPQEKGAHFKKISAFLALYNEGLEPEAAAAVTAMFEAWNRQSSDIGDAWQGFVSQLPAIRRHATAWADHLLAGPNLADRLVEFCENKLK